MDLTRKELIKIIAAPRRYDKKYTFNFNGLDLQQLDLSNLDLTDCTFDRADLTGVNFTGTRLERVSFIGTNLSKVIWRDTHLTKAVFLDSEINLLSLHKIYRKKLPQKSDGNYYCKALNLSLKELEILNLFDRIGFEHVKNPLLVNAVIMGFCQVIISGIWGTDNKD